MRMYHVGMLLTLCSWVLLARSIVLLNKPHVVLSVIMIALNDYSTQVWRHKEGMAGWKK